MTDTICGATLKHLCVELDWRQQSCAFPVDYQIVLR